MSTAISPALNIIEVRKNKPMVSSLKLAELFGRPHFRVLKSVRGLISRGKLTTGVEVSSWTDSTGRSHETYLLDERASLIAAPFIGGAKAEDVQCQLVDAYLWYRDNFANPPRKDILAAKRAAHHPMMDALIEFREEAGKDTGAQHFMCENKLVNWVVTGVFAKIDEAALSNDQVELLRLVRERNAAFLLAGLDYDTRKAKLAQFATRERTKLLGAQA